MTDTQILYIEKLDCIIKLAHDIYSVIVFFLAMIVVYLVYKLIKSFF